MNSIDTISIFLKETIKEWASAVIINFIDNDTIVSRALPSSSVDYNWFTGKNVWKLVINKIYSFSRRHTLLLVINKIYNSCRRHTLLLSPSI